MLRRRVDDVHFKRYAAYVGDIVPFSSRHHNGIVLTGHRLKIQVVFLVTHLHKSLTFFNTNELIGCRMDFQSDIFANRDTHQSHLKMLSRP
ncbi:hypothetical protein D3C76_1722710 [compost metagenome]